METAYQRDPYYAQSNDPRDLYREHFNISQERQQERLGSDLMGGSWSQPIWRGWTPIIGAGHESFYQRYSQDGDQGFFHSRAFGRGMPLGMNPAGLNHMETDDYATTYVEPELSTAEPVVVEPSPAPENENLELETVFNAEPEQKAHHVPPYSQTINQGMGKASKDEDSILYETPFAYKGKFHRGRGKK
jgi:hypothetical protein